MAPAAENMRTLNQLARMALGQLLGISVILLSLPADFLFGVWVVNKIWHPAVLGGPQMPPHPMSLPVPDWEAAIGFIFWLDAGLIGSYGRQACMVATLMWILLVVFGKGLGTKITSLIFSRTLDLFRFCWANLGRIGLCSQPLKILALDDSAVSRKLVDNWLSGPRYSIWLAKDGQEAFGLFAEHLPAVVVTNWEMSDISRLEPVRANASRVPRLLRSSHPALMQHRRGTSKHPWYISYQGMVRGLSQGTWVMERQNTLL